MPANMISAPTGGSPNVIGSSMAMVATGPTPGSTPISVPTRAPIRQNKTFIGESATAKPWARLAKRSMEAPSEPRPESERQIEAVHEQHRTEEGKHRGPDNRFAPAHLNRGSGGNHQRDEARQHEPEGTDGAREDQGSCDDVERAAIKTARQCDRHQQHGQRGDHGFELAQAQS